MTESSVRHQRLTYSICTAPGLSPPATLRSCVASPAVQERWWQRFRETRMNDSAMATPDHAPPKRARRNNKGGRIPSHYRRP
jgi:hypothetical protein